MKIGFFIDNKNIKEVDCKNIVFGNPGIGGTEYMILIISYMLSIRDNGIEVLLFSTELGIFPESMSNILCKGIKEGYLKANNLKCDYFIYKHMDRYVKDVFSKLPSLYKTKIIPWCHNFCSYPSLRFYAKSLLVERIICVSKEQLDLYIDHAAFLKSDYIFNCLDTNPPIGNACMDLTKRKNIVTYIGSLVPEKGFLTLAKAWKHVLKEIPDAELYVIGSGKLYNRNQKLGKYGIAEAKFERKFVKYIESDNNIHPSVHFAGIMGTEKYGLLAKTKVGVPNPSGLTETFGISAVEMQLCGVKIATIKCPGFLDTVVNGKLYNKKSELAETIILQLKSSENNYGEAKRYIDKNFSIRPVLCEWESLFLDCIPNKKKLHNIIISNNFRGKKIKFKLYQLKSKHNLLYKLLPSFDNLTTIDDKIFKFKLAIKKLIKWATVRTSVLS